MHQVEAIIEWDLMSAFNILIISDRLILESVISPSGDHCALAYVGVEDETNFFRTATSYLELFLLTCALTSDISATYRNVIGTTISSLNDLGKQSVIGYEKIHVLNENIQSPINKPILLAKGRFRELEEDRQEIIDSYLGLALRYYYFALQAY